MMGLEVTIGLKMSPYQCALALGAGLVMHSATQSARPAATTCWPVRPIFVCRCTPYMPRHLKVSSI